MNFIKMSQEGPVVSSCDDNDGALDSVIVGNVFTN
jgi:hypothetical protein